MFLGGEKELFFGYFKLGASLYKKFLGEKFLRDNGKRQVGGGVGEEKIFGEHLR